MMKKVNDKKRVEEINKRANHLLFEGDFYDSYFPKVDCADDSFGSYLKFIFKHQRQTVDISKTLKGITLEDTVNNIHWFLYSHIQYKTVIPEFEIKSPSCAWQSRTSGSDCKTYATFASSILLNLNIKHYLRIVKYSNGTHIYVVVPLNQVDYKISSKSKFGSDYLIIDSTGSKNKERPFIKKYPDTFVSLKTLSRKNTTLNIFLLLSILAICNVK